MATHFKGQRIAELLAEVRRLYAILEDNKDAVNSDITLEQYARAHSLVAIQKAKLTALMGDYDDGTATAD
jgi:hypothetical protein